MNGIELNMELAGRWSEFFNADGGMVWLGGWWCRVSVSDGSESLCVGWRATPWLYDFSFRFDRRLAAIGVCIASVYRCCCSVGRFSVDEGKVWRIDWYRLVRCQMSDHGRSI